MDNNDNYGGDRKSQLYEMIVPPFAAWVLYFLISAIVLVVVNFQALWQFTTSRVIGPPEEVGVTSYSDILSPVFNFTDKLNTPFLMLFWAVIGIFAYFFMLAVEQILFIARKEIRQSKYLQGGVFPIRDYWKTSIKMNLLFITILIVWVVFFMFYVEAALPWFSKLLVSGIYHQLSHIKLLLEVTASLIGNMLCIFLFLLLGKILHSAWNLVRN